MEKDAANRFQSADELRARPSTPTCGRASTSPSPRASSPAPPAWGRHRDPRHARSTQAMARPIATGQNAARRSRARSLSLRTAPFDDEKQGLARARSLRSSSASSSRSVSVLRLQVLRLPAARSRPSRLPTSSVGSRRPPSATSRMPASRASISPRSSTTNRTTARCATSARWRQHRQTPDTIQLVISKGEKPAETDEGAHPHRPHGRTRPRRPRSRPRLKGKAIEEANDAKREPSSSRDRGCTEVEIDTVIEYKVSTGPTPPPSPCSTE